MHDVASSRAVLISPVAVAAGTTAVRCSSGAASPSASDAIAAGSAGAQPRAESLATSAAYRSRFGHAHGPDAARAVDQRPAHGAVLQALGGGGERLARDRRPCGWQRPGKQTSRSTRGRAERAQLVEPSSPSTGAGESSTTAAVRSG